MPPPARETDDGATIFQVGHDVAFKDLRPWLIVPETAEDIYVFGKGWQAQPHGRVFPCPELESLVQRCWSKDAESRPPFEEILKVLSALDV